MLSRALRKLISFLPASEHESTERRAARDFDLLSSLNGYPEIFSVFQGERLNLRVTIKPGGKGLLPRFAIRLMWRMGPSAQIRRFVLKHRAEKAAQRVGKPAAYVHRIDIYDRVADTLLKTQKTNGPAPLFVEMPASYRDEGANYTGRISLDTAGWPPGVYECVVHDSRGRVSEDIYVNVKPQTMEGIDLLCILPSFTWQAYNRIGGGSFYSPELGDRRTISIQRPMHHRSDNSIMPALSLLSAFQNAGVRVACVDSWDVHHHLCPEGKVPVAAILVHDEYCSAPMRAEIDRLLDRGTSLLVLSGNTCWWKIDVEGTNISVVKDRTRTALWHRAAPEEQTLISSFRFAGYAMERVTRKSRLAPRIAHLSAEELNESGGVTVIDPEHPVFHGVVLENGLFGREVPIVYREVDGVPLKPNGTIDKGKYHAGIAPHVIATGLTLYGKNVRKCGVVVEARVRNGYVLHMGSIGWSLGVSQNNDDVKAVVLNAYRHCRATYQKATAKAAGE